MVSTRRHNSTVSTPASNQQHKAVALSVLLASVLALSACLPTNAGAQLFTVFLPKEIPSGRRTRNR
jgi:hypothetical protein